MAALEADDTLLICAATLAEAFIVSERREAGAAMAHIIDNLNFEIVSVTPARARLVADAHSCWGRGVHPAGLNYGDCFAYALANERGCPLLFIGNDFARTDIRSVLADG